MAVLSAALALLSGVIGAGFASGRELACFFACHGAAWGAAVLATLLTLCALFILLPAQLERTGCTTLVALCSARFGARLGRVCVGLFFLLQGVTGGAMLAACAELTALLLPIPHAYALGMAASLLLSGALCRLGVRGLALPGAALALLLPVLLVRLYALPAGEACFLPAMTLDMPVRACGDGLLYGALNAAMLCGTLPLLLPLSARQRRHASLLLAALLGLLLALGTAVCRRHLSTIAAQPLPFVALSRRLGAGGYALVAVCMYAAALSSLCAMLAGLCAAQDGLCPLLVGAACCLLFALMGFGRLVQSAYPVLGALCAALMGLLCLPFPRVQEASPSKR